MVTIPAFPHNLLQVPFDKVTRWFRVDEPRLQELIQQVRADLPTTQALLIGKPQSGKSSIVRGLTGISAEVIGQGFRPHTSHTQRYAYPTAELPLLIFTDTVGLGDGAQQTSEVIQELLGNLEQDSELDRSPLPDPGQHLRRHPGETAARLIILTVKITDFATDTLKQIAQQIRQRHPEIPCLLAVTCLHEAYPSQQDNHPQQDNQPIYPPQFADLDRAFEQIQTDFQGLFDRAVMIDFTLEADGFEPLFYGLDPLVDAIAALLPEAEARTLSQLLSQRSIGDDIGNLYRDAARRYILPFSIIAGTLAAVPLPLATMPVLTALQVSLVGLLGQLYGQTLSVSQAGGLVSAIAGGFLAQTIGRELVKLIPGLGSVIAASWASAYTWALGETACVYFGDLMGGKTPDPQRIQASMQEAFSLAKAQLKQISAQPSRYS
jgi:uncharacterized protein (DUF697 family)/predicted GTPase